MINIDETRLLELLDKAVAERGAEYQYVMPEIKIWFDQNKSISRMMKRCIFVDSSTGERRPSCLVGMMLYLAGVPLEILDVDPNWTASQLLNKLMKSGIITAPQKVLWALTDIQSEQDTGLQWGEIAADVAIRFGRVQTEQKEENND